MRKESSRLKDRKITELCKSGGFDNPLDLIKETFNDGVSPGICLNAGCNYTISVEPDCYEGWCEECEDNSVSSILCLMEMI